MNDGIINRLAFFSELAPDDRAWLQSVELRRRTFRAKSEILQLDNNYDCAYYINSGWAYHHNKVDNTRQITAIFISGDFFNLNVGKSFPRGGGLVLFENTEITQIPRKLVAEMVDRRSIANALLSASLIEANSLRVWLSNLGKRNAANRVAHLICELQTRLMINTGVKPTQFQFPFTQANMGDTLGLTAVHLNRTLRVLREAHLTDVAQGKIIIKDQTGLHELVKFDPGYLYPAGRLAVSDGA